MTRVPTPVPVRHALPAEAPGDAVAPAAFRAGMRALAGAVTVLTTALDGRRAGLTATAVCSLSAEPPRLIACVNRRGASYAAFAGSGVVCVNVLASGQADVAQRFAGAGPDGADRFAAGGWRAGEATGAPVLAGAVGAFECRIAEIVEAATHGILVGDVVRVHAPADPHAHPLLYADGRFATLAEPEFDPRHAFSF
jgi:flavin reductase (DIM6/NTAB) family NADH-FMN oxidoreductase RutF